MTDMNATVALPQFLRACEKGRGLDRVIAACQYTIRAEAVAKNGGMAFSVFGKLKRAIEFGDGLDELQAQRDFAKKIAREQENSREIAKKIAEEKAALAQRRAEAAKHKDLFWNVVASLDQEKKKDIIFEARIAAQEEMREIANGRGVVGDVPLASNRAVAGKFLRIALDEVNFGRNGSSFPDAILSDFSLVGKALEMMAQITEAESKNKTETELKLN